jgi:transcriptional regulator with GAF, ATPase, and Fis domain
MPSLVLQPQGQIFPIKKLITTIGNVPQNDIVLRDNSVASLHCLLIQEGEQYFLVSKGRTTLVNQRRIKKQLLHHNDKIKIGKFNLIFSLLSPEADFRVLFEELESAIIEKKGKAFLNTLKEKLDTFQNELVGLTLKNKHYQALQELSCLLTSSFKPEQVLNTIIDTSLKIFGAERGFLMLQAEGGELTPKVARKVEKEKISDKRDLTISYSTIKRVCSTREPVVVSNVSEEKDFSQQSSIIQAEIKSILCTPLVKRNGELLGVIYLDTRVAEGVFTQSDLELIKGFSNYVSLVLEREEFLRKEQAQLGELIRLKEKARYVEELKRIEAEKDALLKEVERSQFEELIGSSPAMQEVFKLIKQVAPTEATVLIQGETGTGKELVARSIHANSLRAKKPFVTINCGAIPKELLESELFGYVKGAFTGAVKDKAGKFELAEGGSVFLDEIGELPLSLQPKILRVLQNGELEKVGAKTPLHADVRILAATHKDLEAEVERGAFRQDLYFRLNIVLIKLPPLRERKEEILLLSNFFLNKFAQETRKPIKGFLPEAIAALQAYNWPGNVRELQNKIYRAVILCQGEFITPLNLGFDTSLREPLGLRAQKAAFEKRLVQEALIRHNFNLSRVASELKISHRGLRKIIAKHGIAKENLSKTHPSSQQS